ncbi:MAG: DUF4136 domain-containing protein [Woeseiaceae bacterium]|nr:DUF4136 domain-containing protein [Woeseiaceae bacterium]NIP21104.1 DUF4136 domain-containing protein [Woeseiaceae bacterium]NIS90076.1 DUF4136 domain-containing protein [Woeseiaceae bacterium]
MNHLINKAAVRVAALVSFVALLTACSSGPRIVTNSAPGFSLAGYQTFSFLQPLSTDNGNVRTLLSSELINSAQRELENAGLRHVDRGGDLLVNFVVSTRETLQTRPSSGASIHHGAGRYGTWGGYSMSVSTTEVVQRTEGTVGIDIIDAQRQQLVWEGAATGRVTDQVRQNRAAAVDLAVRDIFAQFP